MVLSEFVQMEKLYSAVSVTGNFLGTAFSGAYEFGRDGLYTCIKWFCKGDHQKLLFVFVGLERSGKSTAIRNIFGEPDGKDSGTGNPYEIASTEIVSSDGKNTILDVHSLYSSKLVNENSKILFYLQEYLKRKEHIPSIVFLTARLTDERFQGESSEFRMSLKALLVIRDQLTDKQCSNVILLLTHADRPGIQNSLKARKQAYKKEFATVFGVEPVCLTISDTHLSYDKLYELELQDEKLSVFHGLFLDFVNGLYENRQNGVSTHNPFILRGYKSSIQRFHFLGYSYQVILDTLKSMQGGIKQTSQSEGSMVYSGKPLAVTDRSYQTNSFGNYKIFSYLKSMQDDVVYNLISPSARILLEDRTTTIAAKKCMVGQKVFGFNNPISVITNVIPVFGNEFCSDGKLMCGRVYMTPAKIQHASLNAQQCVTYNNRTVSHEKVDRVPRIGSWVTDVRYYYVEVNGGSEPFVVDDFVCYSTGPRVLELEFDHITDAEISSVREVNETALHV